MLSLCVGSRIPFPAIAAARQATQARLQKIELQTKLEIVENLFENCFLQKAVDDELVYCIEPNISDHWVEQNLITKKLFSIVSVSTTAHVLIEFCQPSNELCLITSCCINSALINPSNKTAALNIFFWLRMLRRAGLVQVCLCSLAFASAFLLEQHHPTKMQTWISSNCWCFCCVYKLHCKDPRDEHKVNALIYLENISIQLEKAENREKRFCQKLFLTHLSVGQTKAKAYEFKFLKSSIVIQGGPKVGIELLNYFLYVLKLPAVHFMLLV